MESLTYPTWVRADFRNPGLTVEPGHGCDPPAQIQSFVALIRACTRNKDLCRGTSIHHDLVQRGLLETCSDALVTMYAKCGELERAEALLEIHKSKDVITWTALVTGYVRGGLGQTALDCLERMRHESILPDAVTYVSALKACATIRASDRGKQIHDEIARQRLLENNIALGGALVDMYVKCGDMSEARRVLEGLPFRDVVSWSALIAGYAQEGQAEEVLTCIEQMQDEGIFPDAVTYICALKACAMIRAAERGKYIHKQIARQRLLQNNIMLGGALVDMYAKSGNFSEARQVLKELPYRDVVCWNALIAGYAQEGEAQQALHCLDQMQSEGILPDAVTYVSALKACATIRDAVRGRQFHEKIARQDLLQNNIVLGGALVDMYAKCGNFSEAQRVLDELPRRGVVAWNALIAGYAQECQAEQALNCLEQMQHDGILPNAATYLSALKACAIIRASDRGKDIHDRVARQGLLQNSVELGGALVDMYAKCGYVSEARRMLEELPCRDVVCWNALITGYAQEGEAEQALDCFSQMQRDGILPNGVTCASVLKVCSHRGLIEEGEAILMNMSTKYGVKPSLECYACMIDLFGRAGHLEKAVRLVQEMPSSDDSNIWYALLGACWKWVDVNVGRWAFEQAVKLGKADDSAYILMTNIYTAAGMGDKAKSIEAMRIRYKA